MTEREKMLAGMIYDPSEPELQNLRTAAHKLCNSYNKLDEDDETRNEILSKLLPHCNGAYLQGPIYFDYGLFTTFGKGCFANFNLTVLDCCPVTIGDNVFIGSGVSIVTPVHPLLPAERNMYEKADGVMTDKEYAKPINIGSDCWIASNVTICGGVSIGDGTVIGAGSVVTRDVPSGVFAAGNPCRIVRKLTEKDSVYLKPQLWEKKK
ncbi:MAG: sugar O-acetyltransferase [Clostridiales bacterium]|nr:sugar O-acetyltransferase [Clostridiales bacterium]